MEHVMIGILGRMGSGKSTVAEILVHKYGFTRIKFSQPLKDMLKAMGLSQEQLEGEEKELPIPWLGVTPRHIMQTLGTEWGRDLVHHDLWTVLMEREIVNRGHGKYVCDDVRFENEASTLKKFHPCYFWEVQRPGPVTSTHPSEEGLKGFQPEGIIVNDGNIAQLHDSVQTALDITQHLPNP